MTKWTIPVENLYTQDELDQIAQQRVDEALERAAQKADIAAALREALFNENGASINASKAVQAEEIAAAIRALKDSAND